MNSLLLLFHFSVFTFTGRLVNPGGNPVPFANISIIHTTDSTVVTALTDEGGRFAVVVGRPGTYLLHATSIGYAVLEKKITMDSQNDVQLNEIVMTEVTTELGEVAIRATRPGIEQFSDRTVINLENNVLTTGSSVLEILERSPGIVRDPRSNSLLMNGKTGVQIMLDGKPVRMPMEQLLTLLQGMSGNDLEKLELFSSPTARFDADGGAGVINIVSKRQQNIGTSGTASLTAGYGRREKLVASIQATQKTQTREIFGSYTYSRDHSPLDFSANGDEIVPILGGPTAFSFWNQADPTRNSHQFQAGFEKRKQTGTWGLTSAYVLNRSTNRITNRAEYVLYPDSILLFNAAIRNRSSWQNASAGGFFQKNLGTHGNVSVHADWLAYKISSPGEVASSFVGQNGQNVEDQMLFASRQRGYSKTGITVGVVKADYAHTWGRGSKLEAGAKLTRTASRGRSGVMQWQDDAWVGRMGIINHINVSEEIAAAYGSLENHFNERLQLTAGLRYEYAYTSVFNVVAGRPTVDRKMHNFFPSLILTSKLNTKNDLTVSYTKRITRPAYNDLNSYVSYNDPISFFAGNPLLRATITQNMKLGWLHAGFVFNLLFSHDQFPMVQGQITTSDDGRFVYITPENLRYMRSVNFETSIPVRVTSWWQMNYTLLGGFRKYSASYTPQPFTKSFTAFSASASQTFRPAPGFTLELSAFYNSAVYGGNSRTAGNGAVNLGLRKELGKNNGSLQLSVTDLLMTMQFRTHIGLVTQDAFDSDAHVRYNAESRQFPVIKLTYQRALGKVMKATESRPGGASEERSRIR